MANIIMGGLALLWAAALFGGFAFGTPNAEGTHRVPRPLRMLSSAVLVGAAWLWAVFFVPPSWADFAFFVAIGMTLGFIGDLFMARLIIQSDHYVLGGIGAFGLGHVFYITGLLRYAASAGLDDGTAITGAWLVWMTIGAVAWFVLVWRTAPHKSALHIAALPYALLLASTAGFATGIALQSGGFALIALGAALFLLSDLILALQLFNGLMFKGIGDVVWLTYGPGQMLIVYGAWMMSL